MMIEASASSRSAVSPLSCLPNYCEIVGNFGDGNVSVKFKEDVFDALTAPSTLNIRAILKIRANYTDRYYDEILTIDEKKKVLVHTCALQVPGAGRFQEDLVTIPSHHLQASKHPLWTCAYRIAVAGTQNTVLAQVGTEHRTSIEAIHAILLSEISEEGSSPVRLMSDIKTLFNGSAITFRIG